LCRSFSLAVVIEGRQRRKPCNLFLVECRFAISPRCRLAAFGVCITALRQRYRHRLWHRKILRPACWRKLDNLILNHSALGGLARFPYLALETFCATLFRWGNHFVSLLVPIHGHIGC